MQLRPRPPLRINHAAKRYDLLKKNVKQLRKDVFQLHDDNARLTADLQISRTKLQYLTITPILFYSFPKLPAEVRDMVWTFALRTPQIMVWKSKTNKFAPSNLNMIMSSCHEAARVGAELCIPYFQRAHTTESTYRRGRRITYKPARHVLDVEAPKTYINLDIDTIWFPQGSSTIPFGSDFFCSRCPCDVKEDLMGRGLQAGCEHDLRLARVAVSAWEEPNERRWSEGSLRGVTQFTAVKEVLIVVEQPRGSDDEHVGFINATGEATVANVDLDTDEGFQKRKNEGGIDSWRNAAVRMEGIIHKYKRRYTYDSSKQRKLYQRTLEGPGRNPLVPFLKVTYVEAISLRNHDRIMSSGECRERGVIV